jgi:signal peptidase I
MRSEAAEVTSQDSTYSDVMAQEVLAQGFCIRVRGRGHSMYPLIQTGDILLIEPKSPNRLNIGDIIFYRRPWGDYVVHRLIKKNGSATLLTKGDNQYNYDPPVSFDEVLGRVIKIEKDGKQVNLTGGINQTLGWLIAWLALGHIPLHIKVKRRLGRLWRLIGGRQMA